MLRSWGSGRWGGGAAEAPAVPMREQTQRRVAGVFVTLEPGGDVSIRPGLLPWPDSRGSSLGAVWGPPLLFTLLSGADGLGRPRGRSGGDCQGSSVASKGCEGGSGGPRPTCTGEAPDPTAGPGRGRTERRSRRRAPSNLARVLTGGCEALLAGDVEGGRGGSAVWTVCPPGSRPLLATLAPQKSVLTPRPCDLQPALCLR